LELNNIQFRTTVFQNNSRHHGVYFEPGEKMRVINQFLITYRNSESVQKLLIELIDGNNYLNGKKKHIEVDESHIYITNSKAIFDMELVTELKPIEFQLDDAIELFEKYKKYLIKYEEGKIPGLLPISKIKNDKWNYISGWEKEGKIKPEHLVKWAYLENGFFVDQDEDLMMYSPELILTMYDLMLDEHSKRKTDLLKILKNYADYSYRRTKDINVISEFRKITSLNSDNEKHIELIKFITKMEKEKAR